MKSTSGNTDWINKQDWDYLKEYKDTFGFRIKYNNKNIMEINYTPRTRCVLVKDSQEAGLEANSKLIVGSTLSDADRLKYGGISKAAELANKTSEEQTTYSIIKTGSFVDEYKEGDTVIFQGGANGHSIKINGEYYLQLGVHDILGKFN